MTFIDGFTGTSVIPDALTTSNNTKTVIQTIPIPADSSAIVTCRITGIKTSDGSLAANGIVHASYKNDGGSLTEQNYETGAHFEFPSGWDFVIDISSQNIRPSVTGGSFAINWTIETTIIIAS